MILVLSIVKVQWKHKKNNIKSPSFTPTKYLIILHSKLITLKMWVQNALWVIFLIKFHFFHYPCCAFSFGIHFYYHHYKIIRWKCLDFVKIKEIKNGFNLIQYFLIKMNCKRQTLLWSKSFKVRSNNL